MYYGINNKEDIYKISHTEYKVDLYEFEKWTIGSEDTFYARIANLKHYTFHLSALYVITIFSIQHLMKKRAPYDLRMPLAFWSGALAIFSIFGAARSIPELVHVLTVDGFRNSVCHPSYSHGITSLWTLLFILSKPVELGDTIFIVLRKQKLIFLHWYHHITVMIYAWHSGGEFYAPGRWFIAMNYAVHGFMYSYYTMRAMRVKMPNCINIFITSMQIAQMIVGLMINIAAYFISTTDHHYCHAKMSFVYSGLLMYGSYFLLFGNFFYQTYVRKGRSRKFESNENKFELNKDHLQSDTVKKSNIEFGEVLKSVADIERHGFLVKEKEQ